jgi:hypothetical protein
MKGGMEGGMEGGKERERERESGEGALPLRSVWPQVTPFIEFIKSIERIQTTSISIDSQVPSLHRA